MLPQWLSAWVLIGMLYFGGFGAIFVISLFVRSRRRAARRLSPVKRGE